MTEERKVQLGFGVDATEAEQGIDRIEKRVGSMAQAVGRAGETAGKGVEKIGAGSAAASEKVDAAARNMIGSIQRATAALEAGSKSGAKYYESLAQQRGINPEVLRPYLAQLDAVKVKTAAATAANAGMTTSFGGLASAAAGAALRIAAFAGVASLGGIALMVQRINTGVDALNDLSDATGSSIENISALESVSKRTGGNFDTVSTSLIKFNMALGQTEKPGSDAEKVIKAIGLSAKDLRDIDPAEALRKTAIALAQFADDGNKARAVQELFGKSLKEVAPFLKDLAEAGDLNATVTKQQALEAEKFNKELFKMQAAMQDVARAIANPLVTGFNQMLEYFRTAQKDGESLVVTLLKIPAALQRQALGLSSDKANGFTDARTQISSINSLLKNDTSLSAGEIRALVARRDQAQQQLAGYLNSTAGAGRGVAGYGDLPKGTLNLPEMDKKELGGVNKELERQAKLMAELAGLSGSFAQDWADLNALFKRGELSLAQLIERQAQVLAKQPAIKAAHEAEAKALEAIAKAEFAAAQAREKYVVSLIEGLDKVQADIVAQKEQTARLGLTKEAIAELDAAKIEMIATDLELRAIKTYDRNLDESEYTILKQQAEAYRQLAVEKRNTGAKETALELEKLNVDAAKKAQDEWQKASDSINASLTDALLRGFESGKGFARNLRDTLVNMFKTLVLRPIISAVMNPIAGAINGFVQPIVQGVTGGLSQYLGLASNASSANTLYNGATGFYNGGIYGAANNLGYGSSFAGGGVFGQTGAYSGAMGVGGAGGGASGAAELAGSTAAEGSAAGGLAGAAAGAAAFAIFAYIANEIYQDSKGERRGGARFDFDSSTGKTSYTNGPDGDRAAGSDDLVKGLISATAGSLNDAFKSFGSAVTVAALAGAYETSADSRGGVFSGGRLSTGALFGEDGSGTNYDPTSPLDSKYEAWGLEASRMGGFKNVDLNGDPAKLATDLQQAFLEGLQSFAGIVPRIVRETFREDFTGTIFEGTEADTPDATRWVRVFDQGMKDRARELGLIPKKILDLIIDIDPESLTAEATTALATKISTLVTNVNGFRAIVESLPVGQLRDVAFDVAASLVELSGGLAQFGANLGTFVENFYSDTEKRDFIAGNISKTLGAAGISITPEALLTTTREQFRLMVEGQDLTTEAGQKAYAALIGVSGAFAGITPEVESATESLDALTNQHKEYAAQLRKTRDEMLLSDNSPLSATGRRAKAESIFNETLSSAIGGDETAIRNLGGTGQDFIDAVQKSARTSLEVVSAFSKVQAALTIAAASEDARAIPGFAGGGLASGGIIAGEEGREYIDLETPGRVYTAQQTAGMFSSGDLVPLVNELLAEIRALRAEGGTANEAIISATVQTAARLNRWDKTGIPLGDDLLAEAP